MTLINLATCLGPNMLVSDAPLGGAQAIEHSQFVPLVFKLLADHVESLFPVCENYLSFNQKKGAMKECFSSPPSDSSVPSTAPSAQVVPATSSPPAQQQQHTGFVIGRRKDDQHKHAHLSGARERGIPPSCSTGSSETASQTSGENSLSSTSSSSSLSEEVNACATNLQQNNVQAPPSVTVSLLNNSATPPGTPTSQRPPPKKSLPAPPGHSLPQPPQPSSQDTQQ